MKIKKISSIALTLTLAISALPLLAMKNRKLSKSMQAKVKKLEKALPGLQPEKKVAPKVPKKTYKKPKASDLPGSVKLPIVVKKTLEKTKKKLNKTTKQIIKKAKKSDTLSWTKKQWTDAGLVKKAAILTAAAVATPIILSYSMNLVKSLALKTAILGTLLGGTYFASKKLLDPKPKDNTWFQELKSDYSKAAEKAKGLWSWTTSWFK